MADGSERRRHKRKSAEGARVTCRRTEPAGSPDLAVALLDLSQGGIGLRLSEPVEPGEELSVDVEADWLPTPVRATGIVRWAVQQESGACTVGVAFHGPLADSDVWGLSHDGTDGTTTEPGGQGTRTP